MSAAGVAQSKSRLGRTLRSLAVMAILGIVLGVTNMVLTRRDVGLATGPAGPAQKDFLVNAAERPDIATFFKKNLDSGQRILMARNIGRYDDPKLAKLCGILLADFDPAAREELTVSLAKLAVKRPESVAEQLTQKGSFQQIAVNRALTSVGPSIWPLVVKQFSVVDARPNAINYLASMGPSATQFILPSLDDKRPDVRLAAADALAKLRSPEAVDPLVKLYGSTIGDEQYGYLAALSGIGDPKTSDLMSSTLQNDSITIPRRALAALGLGRVGGEPGAKTLWAYAESEDIQLRQSVVSALQLTKDAALKVPSTPVETQLEVASGVHTNLADSIVLHALFNPKLRLAAADIAKRRPKIVAGILQHLNTLEPDSEGDFADKLITALLSTTQGTEALDSLKHRDALAGIIQRRIQLNQSPSQSG